MKRLLAVLFCAALLCGCAAPGTAQDGDEPATQPPLTLDFPDPAPTEAPTTEAPTTEAPTTEAPTTEAPTTEAPTTEAPTTEAPTEPEPPFCYQGLVCVTDYDDTIVVDQKYATEDNFTGRIHYDRVLCLVHEDILPMVLKASEAARAEGLRLKIWDAYRPISVQQALHDSAPAELSPYVPAPGPWSMHARGITLDVTLCYPDGTNLDMPTDFDDFSTRANSDYADVTQVQADNRALLNRIMTDAGFTRSTLEWWHFDGPGRDNYTVQDLSFAQWEQAREEARAE